MLWELEQLELRLAELQAEYKSIEDNPRLSTREKERRLLANSAASSGLYREYQKLLSIIHSDPALSKQRDAILTERDLAWKAKRAEPKPLPEGERGLQETEGPIVGKEADARDLYQNYAKKWHERSVWDRSNENAKLLESERDQGWEP